MRARGGGEMVSVLWETKRLKFEEEVQVSHIPGGVYQDSFFFWFGGRDCFFLNIRPNASKGEFLILHLTISSAHLPGDFRLK